MVTTTSELSTHRSTTDGDGLANGSTVVDSALAAYPNFDGSIILIMSGDYRGQHRTIDGDTTTGTINLAKAFGGQIVEGINYIITSTVSPQRIDNLSYHATVSTYTNVTTFAASSLAGYGDDYFNDWFVYVTRDSAGAGAAPQGELSQITDYVSATGTFTHAAFTVPLAATDEVIILHSAIGSAITSSDTINDIFNLVNAILTLTETGGTITTDGALQSLYINNAPAGVFQPRKLLIDFTNHVAGDTMIIRTYYRINPTGGLLIKQDEETIIGVQDPAIITIDLEDNRYGYEITIEKTVGANLTYDWQIIYKI